MIGSQYFLSPLHILILKFNSDIYRYKNKFSHIYHYLQ